MSSVLESDLAAIADPAPYASLLESVFRDDVPAIVDNAHEHGRFPRELIELLGRCGVLAGVWRPGATTPHIGRLLQMSERLGRCGSMGAAAGVSAHQSGVAILERLGKSAYLRDLATKAVNGDAVVCLGASEAAGGSNMHSFTTTAEATFGGYRIRGAKKFVSLATVADAIIVVAHAMSGDGDDDGLAVFVVEAADVRVGQPYPKLGMDCLDTAPVEFDVEVSKEAMLARPGTGLAAASVGLTTERITVAGLVLGVCDLALGVAVAQMMRREQFGQTLFDHQALRLRFADLQARVDMLRYALKGLAAEERVGFRTAAGMKVSAARLGEEVMSECLHVFGGVGYLTGLAPAERWWRDMKLARVAVGADEVLWELVAKGMRPDFEAHNRWVTT